MTNSVDSDQIAVWSGSALFLDQSVFILRFFKVYILNIIWNIVREKYFDLVSEG